MREMLLLDLIKDYAPLYPEDADWQTTAEFMQAEEPELLEELSLSLEKFGWREPIRLSEPHELEEGHRPVVLNGTHRVVIAMQNGVITVPVAHTAELSEDPDEKYAELTIKLKGDIFENEEDDFKIFDILRSFPLTNSLWLNSDVCFGSKNEWSFLYILDPSNFKALEREALRRLRRNFPGRKFTAKAKVEEFED